MNAFLLVLRLCWYFVASILIWKISSVLNRWRIYYLQEEDVAEAWQGLKQLVVRGRKETELLLSGDYVRRVGIAYVFQDLARFSEGQSYLNAYFRNRTKAVSEQTVAELEDRRSIRVSR